MAARAIGVAGAGVAGLTVALCLEQAGFRVLVLEKRDGPSDLGAGIQVTPNAYGVLERLGLAPALRMAGHAPEGVRIRRGHDGRRLATVPLGASALDRYGRPYLVIHRADLMAALRHRCAERENIEIRYGEAISDLALHGRGLTCLTFGNERHSEHVVAALIGADGIRSATRRFVVGSSEPVFTGRIAWRALVPSESADDVFRGEHTGLWLGPDTHLVHYPIRQGRVLNFVAIAPWLRGGPPPDRWVKAAEGDPRRGFERWDRRVTDMMRRASGWGGWPLHAHQGPFGAWSNGPVCLIGDAAHAIEPFAAQGAAMAIEDAAVLAFHLSRSRDEPSEAFGHYAHARRKRVTMVRRATEANRRRYHMSGFAGAARDFFLPRLSGEDLLNRLDTIYFWRAPLDGKPGGKPPNVSAGSG